MKVFFAIATLWFAWRVGEDITDGSAFSVMFLHLIFFISSLVGLVLTE